MKLIGAAMPRTGTMSVKQALEQTGFGNCYHMHHVFGNTEHIRTWQNAFEGQQVNWAEMLSDYQVTLDTPACLFWRELMQAFPEAKILLLRREPSQWWESIMATVYQASTKMKDDPAIELVNTIFFESYLHGRIEDRNFAISMYEGYCQEVRETVPAHKLLEYNVLDGWKPLCEFLDIPIPATAFPNKNSRKQFSQRLGQ